MNMLNYGYSLLEVECLRAANFVFPGTHLGFLHAMMPDRNSLAYGFQKPFRFLVNPAVISLVECGDMETRYFRSCP